MKQPPEHRRHSRTQDYGPQKLNITYTDGADEKSCQTVLWDFSEGGLGMDSPRSFATGDIIQIRGNFFGPAYSMSVEATARVAYCRRIEPEVYRVGVAFTDVAFKRLKSSAESA